MVTPSTESTRNTVNPEIVKQIAAVCIEVMDESPELCFAEAVYRCTQTVLRRIVKTDADVVFVYYLQTYRTILATRMPELTDRPMVMAHAALALFEVYRNTTKTHIPALLLRRAIRALVDVIVEIVTNSEDLDQPAVMAFCTDLTILSLSIDYYTAPVRITAHREYLNWLRDFFMACLRMPFDKSLLDNPQLREIARCAQDYRKIIISPAQ